MLFESLYLQLPCDLHRNRQRTRVQCFKDHLLYIKASFMCVCVCVHHDPGCYSGTGDWIKEIQCLHHEARVPED